MLLTLPLKMMLFSICGHKIQNTGSFKYSCLHFIFHMNILNGVISRFGFCSQCFFKKSFSLQVLVCLPPLLLFPQLGLFLPHKNFTVFSFIWNIKFLSHNFPSTFSIYIHRSGLMALHYNPSGDVFEHHTVAGFVGGLSSGSGSSHKLLLKLVLIEDRQIYQVLFTGCQNTCESSRERP